MRIPTSRLRAVTASVLLALGSAPAAADTQPPVEVPVEQPGPAPDEPSAPVVVDLPPLGHLDDDAGYLLPDQPGLTWLVDGTPAADLVAAGAARHVPGEPGHVEVTAEGLGRDLTDVVVGVLAAEGHLLATDDGGTALVRYVLDPRTAAELVLPEALDEDGTEADAVLVPEAPGQVVRGAAGEALAPGVHLPALAYVDGAAVLELTVTAAGGHRLEVDGMPVEPLPGAGAVHGVTLSFADTVAPPAEVEPSPEPEPETTEPEPPAAEPSPPPLLTLDAAAPEQPVTAAAVTPPATAPTPRAVAPEEPAPPEAAPPAAERGVQDTELLVLLGAFFLGGLGLVLGVGRDAR